MPSTIGDTHGSPKVSVIIPVWGQKYLQYLAECLQSVYKQTFQDFEVILSTDSTDLPTARNRGIEKAKGEYIVVLDCDDMLDPTFLEKLIGLDDIACPVLQMFGDCFNVWAPPLEHPKHEDFRQANQLFCSALFKRKVWETIGGFDESMKDGYEDWDFWLRATKAGFTVTTIKDILFRYRKHGHSLVNDAHAKDAEIKAYMLAK